MESEPEEMMRPPEPTRTSEISPVEAVSPKRTRIEALVHLLRAAQFPGQADRANALIARARDQLN